MSKLKLAFLAYRSDPFSGGQGIYLKNVTEALLLYQMFLGANKENFRIRKFKT